jgi:chemotaxis signal transduction protein
MNQLTPLLAFVVSGRRLALPLSDIRRLLPLPLLEAPVGAPRFLEGFFDFAGTQVAAVRLDALLKLEEEKLGVYSPLLMLNSSELPIALHVASVMSVLKVSAAEIQPIGRDETFNSCVVGRVGEQGESIYLLSSDDLLLTEERSRIAAHRSARLERLEALGSVDAQGQHHAA